MKTHLLRLMLMLVVALFATTTRLAAQDLPRAPFGPRDMKECDAYAAELNGLFNSLAAQHNSCLEGNKSCKKSPAEGATCDCPSCQGLHDQRDNVDRMRYSAVSQCRAEVRAYQDEIRKREEEERRRKEEEERRRREEERRRQEEERKRQEEERQRQLEEERQKRAEEQQKAQEDRERDEKDRQDKADRDRQDREWRDKLERDRVERERNDAANRERLKREADENARRMREQAERDAKAITRALEATRYQEEALERRNQEREQYVQQLENQRSSKQEAVREEQARTGSSAASTFDKLKDAVKSTTTATRSADDLLGGFAMDDASTSSDRTARTIDQLIDQGKSANPMSRIPLELLRQPFQTIANMPDRVFNAIGDVENADLRTLDAIPGQFQQELLSPSRFASVLINEGVAEFRERYKSQMTQHVAAETLPISANIQQRAAQTYYTRDVTTLVRSNTQNRVQWLTQGAAKSGLYEMAANGVPVLYDANGKPYRFDPTTKRAAYSAQDIPALVEKMGLRLQPMSTEPFVERTVIFTPMPEKSESALATQWLNDWLAGKIVGATFKPLEGR